MLSKVEDVALHLVEAVMDYISTRCMIYSCLFLCWTLGVNRLEKINVDGSHFSNLDDLDPVRANKDAFTDLVAFLKNKTFVADVKTVTNIVLQKDSFEMGIVFGRNFQTVLSRYMVLCFGVHVCKCMYVSSHVLSIKIQPLKLELFSSKFLT